MRNTYVNNIREWKLVITTRISIQLRITWRSLLHAGDQLIVQKSEDNLLRASCGVQKLMRNYMTVSVNIMKIVASKEKWPIKCETVIDGHVASE